MFNAREYLNNIAETPNDMYRNLNQATIDSQWEDTTQITIVKEQSALPFKNEYEEFEAWVDNVSDNLVNTSKNYSDFVNILFRDLQHKQNYKGQYYRLNLDGEHEEVYICYDRMNKLNQIPEFKCVRCNNVLTFIDEFGKPLEIPCYLGEDISSTNNLISKDGITPNSRMVIFVQYNEYTKTIRRNQRFLFEHSTAFKVEEIDNYIREQGTDGQVTFIKMYVDFSAIIPQDNLELNLCNYNLDYSIFIQEEDSMYTSINSNGKLDWQVFDKDKNPIDLPIIWESSDLDVIIVDNKGNYTVVGKYGQNATLTVHLKDNKDVKDTIDIYVDRVYSINQSIVVLPDNVKELFEKESIDFICSAYIDGIKQTKTITCVGSGADADKYEIQKISNGYRVTSLGYSPTPLTLTFECKNYPPTVVQLKLKRAL